MPDSFGPDLVPGALSVRQQGAQLSLFATVMNLGDSAAGSFDLDIVLSEDALIDPDDLLLGRLSVAGIAPGNLVDIETVLDLPAGAQGHVGLRLDSSDAVAETDEGNNSVLQTLAPAMADQQPHDNIDPFVLVTRPLGGPAALAELSARPTLAAILTPADQAEAAETLAGTGATLLPTGSLADALDLLDSGGRDAVLIYRDDPGLTNLIEDYDIYEVPGGGGALQPYRDDIHLTEGTSGDDLLYLTDDADLILGGEGTDTLVIAAAQRHFTLTMTPHTATLTDRRGAGGIDTLVDIERLDFTPEIPLFSDAPMPLDLFSGPAGLQGDVFAQIAELYIAYFNRAPDALGLYYWGTEYARGFTLPQMAASFFDQPETRATYADVLNENGTIRDSAAFVEAVYGNVLGRAPDAAGFQYWSAELAGNPDVTPAVFILSLLGGAKYPENPTPQHLVDQAYLTSKTEVGTYFAAILGMSDVGDASTVMAFYDGTETGWAQAVAAADAAFADASSATEGDFLMPLVGVIEDPFALF
ncbi:MAG: DUF4214 domain-containing protein [Sulfitobacter sp.]|nr:DUF4214 domain-containing protein [Sulfitobacter sp.]